MRKRRQRGVDQNADCYTRRNAAGIDDTHLEQAGDGAARLVAGALRRVGVREYHTVDRLVERRHHALRAAVIDRYIWNTLMAVGSFVSLTLISDGDFSAGDAFSAAVADSGEGKDDGTDAEVTRMFRGICERMAWGK